MCKINMLKTFIELRTCIMPDFKSYLPLLFFFEAFRLKMLFGNKKKILLCIFNVHLIDTCLFLRLKTIPTKGVRISGVLV